MMATARPERSLTAWSWPKSNSKWVLMTLLRVMRKQREKCRSSNVALGLLSKMLVAKPTTGIAETTPPTGSCPPRPRWRGTPSGQMMVASTTGTLRRSKPYGICLLCTETISIVTMAQMLAECSTQSWGYPMDYPDREAQMSQNTMRNRCQEYRSIRNQQVPRQLKSQLRRQPAASRRRWCLRCRLKRHPHKGHPDERLAHRSKTKVRARQAQRRSQAKRRKVRKQISCKLRYRKPSWQRMSSACKPASRWLEASWKRTRWQTPWPRLKG
mmetsp:Transcript_60427/g.112215  ORF Transcript_60427/g.112215 Transcript_60427/m.112215 type:complete len:270 (-) Transcript_60427:57-866(-)